jgi:RNA polymerase sigma-70 factor (ECF subfamily)
MSPNDPGPDAGLPGSSLLQQLKARHPAGWERFARLYGPLVYSWCRARWGLAPADAADVLQEVAVRVLESVADFRGGNFAAWLWTITRSRVADHFRRNPERAVGGSDFQDLLAEVADHREGPDPAGPAETAGDEAAGPGALGGVLRRALDRVRARAAGNSWQAFWEVTVRGRAPADVAADLGLSVNAVYIANSRILGRLRAELGRVEGEGLP